MATDAAREARLGALLSSLGVGDGREISQRRFADMTGFSRGKVARFFAPLEPGEVRRFNSDTANVIASVLPVDATVVAQAIQADTHWLAAQDSEALRRVLTELPNMNQADLGKLITEATAWFTGVRDAGGDGHTERARH